MTTSSLTSAPPTDQASTSTHQAIGPRRRPVDHLFWLEALTFAMEHDLPVRSLCGVWEQAGRGAPDVRKFMGPVVEPRKVDDCRRCARIYENWAQKQDAS